MLYEVITGDVPGTIFGHDFKRVRFGACHVAGHTGTGSACVRCIAHPYFLMEPFRIGCCCCILIAGFAEDGGTGGQVMGVDETQVGEVAGRDLDDVA